MGGRDRLNDTEREQPVAPSSADRVETFAEFGHWQWSRAEGFACSPGARRALGQIRLGVTAKQLLRRLTAESRHMLLAAIRAVTLGAPALTLELVDRSSPAVPRTLAVMVESIDAPTSSIGGLIRDDESTGKSGVPFLSKVPLLRDLFGSTNKSKNRTELIVLITPRVISNSDEARQMTEDYSRQFESLTPLRVERGNSTSPPPPPAQPAQTYPTPEPAKPNEDVPRDH